MPQSYYGQKSILVIQIRITFNFIIYFNPSNLFLLDLLFKANISTIYNIQPFKWFSLSLSLCFQYELLHFWIDMRIRDTNKKNGALEFVIQQQTMTMLQPLTVAWTLQLFLSNHPVKYARHAMPLCHCKCGNRQHVTKTSLLQLGKSQSLQSSAWIQRLTRRQDLSAVGVGVFSHGTWY